MCVPESGLSVSGLQAFQAILGRIGELKEVLASPNPFGWTENPLSASGINPSSASLSVDG